MRQRRKEPTVNPEISSKLATHFRAISLLQGQIADLLEADIVPSSDEASPAPVVAPSTEPKKRKKSVEAVAETIAFDEETVTPAIVVKPLDLAKITSEAKAACVALVGKDRAAAVQIIQSFGAVKFGDIDPAKHPALLAAFKAALAPVVSPQDDIV